MEELRVTVVSDTHLSPRTPEADANWDAVVRHVERTAPDLVVHLGDLALDGAHDAGDLDWARLRLDRLPVPWRAIPGNHDLGDNPTGGHGSEPTIKPLEAPNDERASAPSFRFVPDPARRRLEGLLDGRTVPLVLSGHVHQFRVLDVDTRRHVWAPTAWAVLPDDIQPTFGAKRCGVVDLALGSYGQAHAGLVELGGLAQHTLSRDIPDPYAG